jgi:hypothetical protein
MKTRPPRRTLRRHVRTLPAHLEHRQMMAALQALRMSKGFDARELESIFSGIWSRGADCEWSVNELKSLGLMPGSEDGRRLGQVLAEIADTTGCVGRWEVKRVDTGRRKLAEGRLWRLARRW